MQMPNIEEVAKMAPAMRALAAVIHLGGCAIASQIQELFGVSHEAGHFIKDCLSRANGGAYCGKSQTRLFWDDFNTEIKWGTTMADLDEDFLKATHEAITKLESLGFQFWFFHPVDGLLTPTPLLTEATGFIITVDVEKAPTGATIN